MRKHVWLVSGFSLYLKLFLNKKKELDCVE